MHEQASRLLPAWKTGERTIGAGHFHKLRRVSSVDHPEPLPVLTDGILDALRFDAPVMDRTRLVREGRSLTAFHQPLVGSHEDEVKVQAPSLRGIDPQDRRGPA